MSELDVRLDWTRGEAQRREGDAFDGSEVGEESSLVEATEAIAEAADPEGAAFEWSDERARAIEAALQRQGPRPAAQVCGLLGRMIREGRREDQLDQIEDWLHSQLEAWQGPVQPADECQESHDEAESFNSALAHGSDGLNLALEVVALLRQGHEPEQMILAERLLGQVNEYFQNARQALLAAEPPH